MKIEGSNLVLPLVYKYWVLPIVPPPPPPPCTSPPPSLSGQMTYSPHHGNYTIMRGAISWGWYNVKDQYCTHQTGQLFTSPQMLISCSHYQSCSRPEHAIIYFDAFLSYKLNTVVLRQLRTVKIVFTFSYSKVGFSNSINRSSQVFNISFKAGHNFSYRHKLFRHRSLHQSCIHTFVC